LYKNFAIVKAPTIASRTQEKLRGMYRNHFADTLGDMDITAIDFMRLQ
jgi:hypothetical protein